MTKIEKKFISSQVLYLIAETLANSYLTVYLINKGFSFKMIGVLWIIFLSTSTVAEYPSGGLADKYGRRKIYSVGIILTAISYVLIINQSFSVLCASYFIKAIGASMISGSLTAWLSCSTGSEEKFRQIIAKSKLFESTGVIIISIVFIFLKFKSLDIIFIIVAVMYLLITLIVIQLPDNYGYKGSTFEISKQALTEFIHSRNLIYAAILNCAVYAYFSIFIFIWQPLALKSGASESYLPIIYAIVIVFTGISSYAYRKVTIESLVGKSVVIISLYIISFVLYAVSFVQGGIVSLICAMAFFGLAKGVVFMVLSTWINRYSKDELKASTFSLVAAIASIFNIILQYILGYVADNRGLFSLIIIAISFGIISLLGLVITKCKLKKY